MTPKNTARLRALEDPAVQAALLRLPQRLILLATRMRDGWTDAAGYHPPQPCRAAWLASIAVAVEILTCCPLRIANLVGLRIGVHLQSAGGQRGRFTHLVIEPHETKNGARIEWPLERQTAELLALYVRDFRPLLAPPGTDWVFPSREHADRPRDKASFGTAITHAIHEHVGVPMHPHLFRGFAGGLILNDNPHALDDLRAVLGHRGFETALRHYRAASTRGAAERLNRLVAGRRATIGSSVPPSNPRRGARRRRRS
jgi:integrase